MSGEKTSPKFIERYIQPDIVQDIFINSDYLNINVGGQKNQKHFDAMEYVNDYENNMEKVEFIKSVEQFEIKNIQKRISAIEWLSDEKNSVVVGGAESGKSALLKYIALATLGRVKVEEEKLLKTKGSFIPVWLPFGYWTSLVEKDFNLSLVDCLKMWFQGMGEDELWGLVENAIKDERLLLLVDGLDEWRNEQAALVCFNKLSVFIETKNIQSIYSSRPSGLERLPVNNVNNSVGCLAGLSNKQQKELIQICVGFRSRQNNGSEQKYIENEIETKVNEIVHEISHNKDLTELASVPLLIYMLIHLKTKNVSLPHSRFSVYKELVRDLVKVQPKRRKTASQIVNENSIFNEEEILSILSMLAYEVQVNYTHGSISVEDVKSYVEKYLIDTTKQFGFSRRDASNQAAKFIEIGESDIGILVKTSPYELGFFHRSFQEFLAASYIANEERDKQRQIFKSVAFNKQWDDVVLGVFSILQRLEDSEYLVDVLKSLPSDDFELMQSNLLLAKIAFGDTKISAITARDIASDAFEYIERGVYFPQAKKLLETALSGYSSNKLQSELEAKIRAWFPSKHSWPSWLYTTIGEKWPNDKITKDILIFGLLSGNIYSSRTSCDSLVKLFSGDETVLQELFDVAKLTLSRHVKLICFETIIKGWNDSKLALVMYRSFLGGVDSVGRLLCLFYETKNGKTSDKNREMLLNFGKELTVEYFNWKEIVSESLQLGYKTDPELRRACTESLYRNKRDSFKDVARDILVSCYLDNELINEYLIEDFSNKYPNISSGLGIDKDWHKFKKPMRESNLFREAVENWIINVSTMEVQSYHLLTSNKGKKFLLEELKEKSSFPFWSASALLECWGMSDPEVAEAINSYLSDDDKDSSVLARSFSLIYKNKKEVYSKLKLLFEAPSYRGKRYDFLLAELYKVASKAQITEIFEIALTKNFERDLLFRGKGLLISFGEYIDRKEIYECAIGDLNSINDNTVSIARAFKSNDDVRGLLVNNLKKLAVPLRRIISERLSKNTAVEFSHKVLSDYDIEFDPESKVKSAIGYYSSPLSIVNNVVLEKHVERLKIDIDAVGPDYEERRQAAFCGFIALNKLDVLNEVINTGDKSRLGVRAFDGIKTSEAFINYSVKNWDYIINSLGSDNIDFLGVNLENATRFYSKLAPYIEDDSKLAVELTSHLINENSDVDDRILVAASRFIPKHSSLLKMCLTSIGLNITNFSVHHSARFNSKHSLVALNILENQFFGSEEAKSILLEASKDKINRSDMLLTATLVIGFTDAPYKKDLDRELKDCLVWLPLAFMNLASVRGRRNKIEEIIRMSNNLRLSSKNYAKYFSSQVSKIFNLDEKLVKEAVKKIKESKSVSEQVVLLLLLNATKTLDRSFMRQALDIYRSQMRKRLPDIIFDVTEGEYSVATLSLTNILYNAD